jgi:hypothetical protein
LALAVRAAPLGFPRPIVPDGRSADSGRAADSDKSATKRDIDALPEQRRSSLRRERWALLTGIEKYEHAPHRRDWRAERDSGMRAEKDRCLRKFSR